MQIIVDKQLVQYKDEGKGPVVLMLHGWGADLTSFNDLATSLAKTFRVIRFDFPGFGGSPKPSDDWYVGDYAALTQQFVAKLGVDVCTVIGHSFGGRVIIKAIAGGQLQPQKVVLMGAAGVKPAASAKKRMFHGLAKTGKAVTALPGLRALRPALRKKLYGAAGTTDYLQAADMQRIFLNTINEDLLPLVHSITQPSLLVWGENDTETPVADAYKIMNELPDGELLVVPDAGHFVYLDASAVVVKSIKAFLS